MRIDPHDPIWRGSRRVLCLAQLTAPVMGRRRLKSSEHASDFERSLRTIIPGAHQMIDDVQPALLLFPASSASRGGGHDSARPRLRQRQVPGVRPRLGIRQPAGRAQVRSEQCNLNNALIEVAVTVTNTAIPRFQKMFSVTPGWKVTRRCGSAGKFRVKL